MRRRAKSCARCSSASNSERQPSPGRATYLASEKGRNLSLEIDGRQNRTSRRSASSGRDEQRQSRKAAHCYVMPYANGGATVTSPTTYKDDFRSPIGHTRYANGRTTNACPFPSSRSTNFRSSPSTSTSLHLSSSNSFQGISRPSTPHNKQQLQHSRSSMTRSATVDQDFGSNKTTYMDHFSWRNGH